jgi:hypothetical protein
MENGKPKKEGYMRINNGDIEKSVSLNIWNPTLHNNNKNISPAIKHGIHTGINVIMSCKIRGAFKF